MRTERCNSTQRLGGNAANSACQHETTAPDLAETVQTAIHQEFGWLSQRQPQLLQQALNEAAALAWRTKFPRLFFPTLAIEKAEAVARWDARQRNILRMQRPEFIEHAA